MASTHEYSALIKWYAIRTKPNQEERASENLRMWEVETLAPWVEKTRQSSARQPLFPGYIFARFEAPRKLHDINLTRGVSYVVAFGATAAPIDDAIIASIRARTNGRGIVRMERPPLRSGDKIVIVSGPLRNFAGVFQKELPGGARVRILLDTIALGATAEVDIADISIPLV